MLLPVLLLSWILSFRSSYIYSYIHYALDAGSPEAFRDDNVDERDKTDINSITTTTVLRPLYSQPALAGISS